MSSKNQLEQVEPSASQSELSGQSVVRRRLIRGAVAAPVLLVSGRSALAGGSTPCALSPMAWMSVHPGGQPASTDPKLSHTVQCSFLGLSPGFWTPNCTGNGKVFQPLADGRIPWKSVSLKAFVELGWTNQSVVSSARWSTSPDSVKKNGVFIHLTSVQGLPANNPSTGNDAGWNSGSKLPFGGDSRSISRILIEENGTLLWHFCAAYLNAMHWPNDYALTPLEVKELYENKTFPGMATQLSDGAIKDFLTQTWN